MKKVTVAEKVAEKETVAVKVVQIKAKKLTRLELLALYQTKRSPPTLTPQ